MPIKYPYEDLRRDERNKVMQDTRDADDFSRPRDAVPTDGPKEGVVSAKPLCPNRHGYGGDPY